MGNCDSPSLEPWTKEEEAELQWLENENIEVKEMTLGSKREKAKAKWTDRNGTFYVTQDENNFAWLLQVGSTTTAASTTDGETNNTAA